MKYSVIRAFFIVSLLTVTSTYTGIDDPITVIGTGYVGLVSGVGLAEFGNTQVICADIDSKKIEQLNKGEIPIYEPGLERLIKKNKKRLTFTNDVDNAIAQAAVLYVAVGTPMSDDGQANLTYVKSVMKSIATNIGDRKKTIVMKSTVPIGTGNEMSCLLNEEGVDSSLFDWVSNPEFLREGSAIKDFLNPERIVIGTHSDDARMIMRSIYDQPIKKGAALQETDVASAETIKYACNGFLATKLSFVNELANLCDKTGADIYAVTHGMGTDSRISPKFLNPGPGYGGSCFPKDTEALLYTAEKHDVSLYTIAGGKVTNEEQKKVPVVKLKELIPDSLEGKTVAVLGLAFKANTDDIRYSPALTTIKLLKQEGAIIQAYDPQAAENFAKEYPDITYFDSAYEAAQDADALLIITEWPEFAKLDLSRLAVTLRGKIIVDARNMLDGKALHEHDFTFATIGRPHSLG